MLRNLHFAPQTRLCNLHEIVCLFFGEVDLVAYLIELCHSNLASLIISVRYANWMDAFIDEICSLLQKRSCKDNHSSSSVPYLVVL